MDTLAAMLEQVQLLYSQGRTAYCLPPVVATRKGIPLGRIRSGDSVIFCCRRGEREIQLTSAFTDHSFESFHRTLLEPLTFVPLIQYHPRFSHLPTAFESPPIEQTLGDVVSEAGLTQLRMAEAEKFAHVTYFMNGRNPEALAGEHHCTVPSNSDRPFQALQELVSQLPTQLDRWKPSLCIVNLATGDLLGHSDDLELKMTCASEVDRALGSVLEQAQARGMWVAITADHGLLEDHGPPGGPINMSHTTHEVPFSLVGADGSVVRTRRSGTLADVAPTVLDLMRLSVPPRMTGRSLLQQSPSRRGPVLLIVLDGWGLGQQAAVNPIRLASTPTWNRLCLHPMAALKASGVAVGLLSGTKGNSEAGHTAIGAGRAIKQDDVLIADAIADGSFAHATAFTTAFRDVEVRNAALHLVGLLSRSSSHGSIDYILELARIAADRKVRSVYIHLITDGRSSRSERLPSDLENVSRELVNIGGGTVVTLVGRGYALDRSGHYEKTTRRAYEALVDGKGLLAEIRTSRDVP